MHYKETKVVTSFHEYFTLIELLGMTHSIHFLFEVNNRQIYNREHQHLYVITYLYSTQYLYCTMCCIFKKNIFFPKLIIDKLCI